MKSLLLKNKWLMAVAAVLLLLLGAAVWRLAVSVGEFNAAKRNLQSASARLAQLKNRDPFPSEDNVALAKENYHELLDAYNELNDRLREGQVLPRPMGDSDFIPLLENTLRRLRAGFAASRVALPQDFTFGFAKYAGGQMPASPDIPRLVQQLQIMETLCEAVMQSRITELLDLSREEFEDAGAAANNAAGRRGRSAPAGAPEDDAAGEDDGALFKSQHFTVTLRGSEPAVMLFLNKVAALPMFTVVTSVELKNSRPGLQGQPAAQDEGTEQPDATAPADPRERPVVIGREDIEARIVMDVYQFAPSLPWDDAGHV